MANITQARLDRQVELERLIEQYNPDATECVEFIHTLQACLRFAYEDKSADAQDALNAACQALEELERTEYPPEIDECDLAHRARTLAAV